MGELLYCHEPIAALPYYVEGIGMNLYSMEELCYYIMENTFLLDNSFMSEELCTWVEKQMGLYKLAEQLRDIMRGKGLLSDFVLAILEQNGYCTMKEMQQIVLTIRQMEEKSDFECNKIRADQLMEKEKYLAGIYEYKRLLDSTDAKEASALLRGNIYLETNQYEEAAKCYEEAYRLNESRESLRECLLCFRCMHDETGFMRKAMEHNIDDMGMQEIKNELSLASKSEALMQFEEQLEKLAEAKEGTEKTLAKNEISDIIFRWKEEYRRSCRV